MPRQPQRPERRPGRPSRRRRVAGTLTNLGSSPSITVNAANGSGTLTTPTLGGQRLADRPHDHVHLHGGNGWDQQRVGHLSCRRAGPHPAPPSNNAGYTTASAGTVSVASQTITVSSLTLAAGNDVHDHVRGHRRRRSRRNGDVEHRRADLAGAGEVDFRRLTHQPRRLTEHHRLRRGRLRHAHHPDDERERVRPAGRSPSPTRRQREASTTARSRSSSPPAGAHRRRPAQTRATRPRARALWP